MPQHWPAPEFSVSAQSVSQSRDPPPSVVVVGVVVGVAVVVIVVEVSVWQQSSWLWHFSSAMQPPSDGQNRVPGGLQGSTMLFPGTQVQYLGVQQPSEI